MTTVTPVGFPPDFHRNLGLFHAIWLHFDVSLDYAIGDLLKVKADQTHILVSGLEFGRKLRLAQELLKRSDHPQKQTLIECISTLQGARRDHITHSYLASSDKDLVFIYRSRGEYGAHKLPFTAQGFRDHVIKILTASQKFQNSYGASPEQLIEFAEAALSIRKS